MNALLQAFWKQMSQANKPAATAPKAAKKTAPKAEKKSSKNKEAKK